MNSRERILGILNREPVDRMPVDIWHTNEMLGVLQEYYNESSPLRLYKKMGVDKMVWVNIPYKGKLPPKKEEDEEVSHWGVRLKPVQAGEEIYLENAESPLSDYNSPSRIRDYPWWPHPDDFDYEGALEKARVASRDFVTLGPWISLFEIYCGLRGLQQALLDISCYPENVQTALDIIEEIQTTMLKRFLSIAGDYIDCIFISDDMGGQNNLLISPGAWDVFIKPRLHRWCGLIHDFGKKVFYHSDGSIEPLIPRLCNAGIDILNPIQHRCKGMELNLLKKRYGEQIIFHGGIDTQRLLPFGTPDDVRLEVEACLQILGRGNQGYICCSCHNIQNGTPMKNILAMIETVHSHLN